MGGKFFPPHGGRWLAGGQTDEGEHPQKMIQKIHGKLFFIPEVLCYNRKKLQSNKFFRENGGGTMRKVNVSIAGQEYTMVAEESEDYVRRCAGHVDSQVQEIIRSASLSRENITLSR